jgi:hypothetical protein
LLRSWKLRANQTWLRRIGRQVIPLAEAGITARGATSYKKALGELISLYQDELAGQGLYEQRKATGDRIQQLQQQIEAWQALLDKLGRNE